VPDVLMETGACGRLLRRAVGGGSLRKSADARKGTKGAEGATGIDNKRTTCSLIHGQANIQATSVEREHELSAASLYRKTLNSRRRGPVERLRRRRAGYRCPELAPSCVSLLSAISAGCSGRCLLQKGGAVRSASPRKGVVGISVRRACRQHGLMHLPPPFGTLLESFYYVRVFLHGGESTLSTRGKHSVART